MTAAAAKNEVTPAQAQQATPAVQSQPVSESAAILSLIERAARDPNVDIDKMERLMKLAEDRRAADREEAFNDAMTKAQAEMRPIAADANNPQTKSKYASYFALDSAVRPIYTKYGFALSFDTEDGAPTDHTRVVCYVTCAGHTRKYKWDAPSDGKGAKGGDVMTKTHAGGAAMTYGQRYLLRGIFNIAIGEDRDGNGAGGGGEKITEKQATEIIDLLEAKGAPRDKFLKWAKVERVEDISATHFASCLTAINNFKA